MTNGFALLDHWSVRQKLNNASSVQLRRCERALRFQDFQLVQQLAAYRQTEAAQTSHSVVLSSPQRPTKLLPQTK